MLVLYLQGKEQSNQSLKMSRRMIAAYKTILNNLNLRIIKAPTISKKGMLLRTSLR